MKEQEKITKRMEERKIYFENGKLYGPKLTVNIESDDYFIDCYKKAARQTIEILDNNGDDKYKIKNIIAFLGNRGQGKTSTMRSFINALVTKNNNLFDNRLDDYDFLNLDIVDPSTFEDCSNVLDIILGQLLDNVKEIDDRDNNIEILNKFNDLYNQIRIIKDKNILNESYEIYDDAIQTLITISKVSNFKKNLKDLIDSCLDLISKHNNKKKMILVIPIDDIDIDLSNCYETVETIRKYLNLPNVIVIMAAKLEQLHEGIRIENLKKMSGMANIDSNSVYEDIYNMSTKYLLKLLPQNRRIHIPNIINDINSLQYNIKIFIDGVEPEFLLIRQYFSKLIYDRTGIVILDNNQIHNYIISGNLRDLVDLYSCLYEMEIPSNGDTDIYLRNLEKFKDYFLNNWCTNNLNFQAARMIRKLYADGSYYKNHSLIQLITELEKDGTASKNNLTDLLKKRGKKELFYDLSDISYYLNKIENHNHKLNINDPTKFVYGVKMCYTIIMNQLRFVDELEGNNEKQEHLMKFIGGRILKEDILLQVKGDDGSILFDGGKVSEILNIRLKEVLNNSLESVNCLKENTDLCSDDYMITLLTLLLSTTSKDKNRDIYFYSSENKTTNKFFYDPFLFFVNCLNFDNTLGFINNEKMKSIKFNNGNNDDLKKYIYQIIQPYEKNLNKLANTIICNFQLYDYLIDYLDLHFSIKMKGKIYDDAAKCDDKGEVFISIDEKMKIKEIECRLSYPYEMIRTWLDMIKKDLTSQWFEKEGQSSEIIDVISEVKNILNAIIKILGDETFIVKINKAGE